MLDSTINLKWPNYKFTLEPSSETQGQIVGARESLNRRKNKARRKLKNGEKSPWGQCLTRTVPNGRRRPGFWLGRKTQVFWHQSEARMASTVWNWSGKTLSPGALLAVLYCSFVPYFSACLDFPSPPLSAPGSPRMLEKRNGKAVNSTISVWILARPLREIKGAKSIFLRRFHGHRLYFSSF